MATRKANFEVPERGECIITWTGMLNGDDGSAEVIPRHMTSRSVVVTGTYGAGGSVRMRGAITATTPVSTDLQTLNDPHQNPLDITAPKIEEVLEGCRWITPLVTAGDGTTNLTVRVHAYARPR